MSYCSNCGGRLNDNGICPNCGGVSEANVKPAQADDSDVFGCIKTFFTDSPLRAVEKAGRTRSASIWVTFSSLFIVAASAMSLAAFGTLSPGFFRDVCGSRIASVIENSSGSADKAIAAFGKLTAHAAVMSILVLILLTIMTKTAFIHAEEKPSVSQALNISAFALFPLSATMLLAIPAAIVSSVFGIILFLIGFSATAIAHYFGIQKASAFRRSPFLTLLCSAIGAAAVLAICSYCLAMLFFG